MKTYSCCECGHEIIAGDYPDPIRWSDGHVCESFRLSAIQCGCGELVDIYGFTNTCEECGADYNFAGQRLAPRSQWGEETGESVADILAIDGTDIDRLFDGN